MMSRKLLIGLLCISTSLISQAKELTFGYISEGQFHPLAVLKKEGIGGIDLNELSGIELIEPLIGDSRGWITVQGPISYRDVYTDLEDKYYKLSSAVSNIEVFYRSVTGNFESVSNYFEEKTVRNFYSFLSNDNWAGNYVKEEILELPIEDLQKKSNSKVHGITDLDKDSKKEIWVSIHAMYDDTGAMVYEEDDNGGWYQIVFHCKDCD